MKPNTYSIGNRFFRSKQIVCLLLILAFFSVVRANASDTADSVYFHIKLDTLGGLHVGQVRQLTYVLANSEVDSASYPVFSDSIEVVNGPEAHKSSSYYTINGVEHRDSETGFVYHVRFRENGKTRIPAASVTAGGKTYTTSEYSVFVQPAEIDYSKLECSLTVEQLKNGNLKYRAILKCNARPDQNPPLLNINGKTVKPNSNAYSTSEGKEEYTYSYFFSSDGYDISCKELTFCGKPYSIKPRKSKLDDEDYIIALLIIVALFELVWWLAYRLRYRKEKDAALAEFVLEKKTLPLVISWAYTHYGASHMLMLFATMFVSMGGVMYYSSNIDVEGILWLGFVPIPFAYILYRRQRRKLDFQSLPTSLDKQDIYDRIYNLSVKYDWDVDHYGEDCIVAHTNPSFLRLSWGEQIFIVFDKGQIWVNSVNDLNKRTSICSFGYNKRNIRRIKEALDSDVQEVYSFAKRECASEQSADYGKNNDNQESIVSTAHTVDAESRNNPADFVELNSSDVKGIIGNGDNDLSFWSLLTPRKGNIATPLLVYINVALFIVMSVNGVSLIEPTGISLMKWGADFGPLTLTGDWWRTITCNFIHIGIMHLLMNMYALLYIGLFLEKIIGSRKVITAYILTGLFSALLSLMIHPETISAGASGSIFGLYGIFLSNLIFNHKMEQNQRKSLLYSIGIFVVYNLLLGAKEEGIDNAAHIGGLVSGIVLGIMYFFADKNESKRASSSIQYFAELIFLFVFSALFMKQTQAVPSDFKEVRTMWDDGTLEEYANSLVSEENIQESETDNPNYIHNQSDNSVTFTGSDKSIGNGKREYVNKVRGLRCTYPTGWNAVVKSDENCILQLMGIAGNCIVFNYKKFTSTEEIDNTRNLLLKSFNGSVPEKVNIDGIPFERISGSMEYQLEGGGSMNFNQSIFFYLNRNTMDGFIIVTMTANDIHESEARDIIASIKFDSPS